MMLKRILALLAVATLVACGGGQDGGQGDGPADPGAEPLVAQGEDLYNRNCAACHGPDLMGTETGPPFLDEIYEPGHHSDESFYAAVQNGVQPHHWGFGAMPPIPALDQDDVEAIVAYVREKQREAGIE